MNRRIFLQGALALSAYIVIPKTLLGSEISKSDIELFNEGFEKGIIENMYFKFNHPIRLSGIDNDLIIRNCTFEFDFIGDDPRISIDNCNGLIIENCTFTGKTTCAMLQFKESA